MRHCIYLVLMLAVVFASTSQAQTSEERIQKLEKICQQQEAQIQKLQERLGVMQDDSSYKQYTEKIVKEYLQQPAAEEDSVGITAGYENGFYVRAAEGNFELKFKGYLQSGFGAFENDTFDNNSFFLHGVDLIFDVYLLKDWHARIQLDFADNPTGKFSGGGYGTVLRDAFVEYIGITEFAVRVGQTHVPLTMTNQYDEQETMTIFKDPFIQSWGHGRDIGAIVHGVIANIVGYKAGLFNGDGANTSNLTDELLMAGQMRFYYCGYKENQNSFIHVGFLRQRDTTLNAGGLNDAGLVAPWGRTIFAGGAGPTDASTEGWRTAMDVAMRFDRDLDGGHNIRVESEFMYSEWQRDFGGTHFSWLHGYGALFGALYRHCLTPSTEGSGILLGFNFSYTQIDNKESSHDGIMPNPNNIPGQRAFVYTAILGYAFNRHVRAAFNWVIQDLDNKTFYGTSKSSGKGGSLEQAWLFQVTAQW